MLLRINTIQLENQYKLDASKYTASLDKLKVELQEKEKRYNERSGVERINSNLKDNYGGRNIRVKGYLKLLCHLMFGILAITVKQLYNILL